MADTQQQRPPTLNDLVAQRLGTRIAHLEIELAQSQLLADQFARQVQDLTKMVAARDDEIKSLQAAMEPPVAKKAKAA